MIVNEVQYYTVTGIFALGIRLIAVQEADFEPAKSCMTLTGVILTLGMLANPNEVPPAYQLPLLIRT